MNNILSSRVKCCIDEKVSELIYTTCSGNIAYAIQLFDNWIQYGYLMFQKQTIPETPKAEEEEKEQKEEKNELQTVVVFVEGVENGTLTLPSQMVDLYKRKMDRFVQTTKMAARLLRNRFHRFNYVNEIGGWQTCITSGMKRCSC